LFLEEKTKDKKDKKKKKKKKKPIREALLSEPPLVFSHSMVAN